MKIISSGKMKKFISGDNSETFLHSSEWRLPFVFYSFYQFRSKWGRKVIKFRSDQRKRNISEFLLLKSISGKSLSKVEEFLLYLLEPEIQKNLYFSPFGEEFQIVSDSMRKKEILPFLSRPILSIIGRNKKGPRIDLSVEIEKKTILPPLRYIGIGYKDKGTLGSGLSWREQILSDESQEEEIPTSSGGVFFHLRILLLLVKLFGRKGLTEETSLMRSENGLIEMEIDLSRISPENLHSYLWKMKRGKE